MKQRLELYDLDRKKEKILENAFSIIETKEINAVWSLRFSLPATDPKADFCQQFHYVRYGTDGALYRILDKHRERNASDVLTFECEHVIAKLVDDVMFGSYIYGNIGIHTDDVIQYVLGFQETQDWVLDACDFSRQFEYSWENENLLAALFSIPNRFSEKYIWKYDTSTYPWRLSLKRLDENGEPEFYVREGKNYLSSEEDAAGSTLCTRLYLLGYGEGINQLTIKDINNGVPYLQSPNEYIERYGLIKRIFTDRRFEDPESLKARGEALLAELQEPSMSRTVSAVDLQELTNQDLDTADVGKVCMLTYDQTKTYITSVTRRLDGAGEMTITIANKPTDISSSIADLADRQRIEQVYAQGATQLYAQSIQANATPDTGAVLNFWIPAEMRIVNKVLAKITLAGFRSYSRATAGGGGSETTSSSGGGSVATSSGSGNLSISSGSAGSCNVSATEQAVTQSSSTKTAQNQTSGPSSSLSSASNSVQAYSTPQAILNSSSYMGSSAQSSMSGLIPHTHSIPQHYHALQIPAHAHKMEHTHEVTIPAHSHMVTIPQHTHTFKIPAHSHSITGGSHSHTVSIPSHSHTVAIPEHTHDIEQGIFEFGEATGASIYINGVLKGEMATDHDTDLTTLLVDATGKIPRGQWHKIEIRPNDLAYVTIDMYIQGFVQSRGGNTV